MIFKYYCNKESFYLQHYWIAARFCSDCADALVTLASNFMPVLGLHAFTWPIVLFGGRRIIRWCGKWRAPWISSCSVLDMLLFCDLWNSWWHQWAEQGSFSDTSSFPLAMVILQVFDIIHSIHQQVLWTVSRYQQRLEEKKGFYLTSSSKHGCTNKVSKHVDISKLVAILEWMACELIGISLQSMSSTAESCMRLCVHIYADYIVNTFVRNRHRPYTKCITWKQVSNDNHWWRISHTYRVHVGIRAPNCWIGHIWRNCIHRQRVSTLTGERIPLWWSKLFGIIGFPQSLGCFQQTQLGIAHVTHMQQAICIIRCWWCCWSWLSWKKAPLHLEKTWLQSWSLAWCILYMPPLLDIR